MKFIATLFLICAIMFVAALLGIVLFGLINYKIRSNEPEWMKNYFEKEEDEDGNINWKPLKKDI